MLSGSCRACRVRQKLDGMVTCGHARSRVGVWAWQRRPGTEEEWGGRIGIYNRDFRLARFSEGSEPWETWLAVSIHTTHPRSLVDEAVNAG